MKLKSKLILGLAGLTLALGSSCPIHKPQPPEPSPYTFYIDPQEIKDKFVQGENVDVSQALDYNPIPNKLVKSLVSYLSSPKSLETARTIYVQYEGINQFPYYSNLEQAVAIVNQYSDATEVQIGEGVFGDGDNYVVPEQPVKITGSGEDKTTLKYIIFPLNEIELSNTRMEGARDNIRGNDNAVASLGVFFGGYIHNNLFYGENGAVAINPSRNVIFENNTFDSVIHPEYQISLSFEGADTEAEAGNIILRYNEIKNTPIAIRLFRSADCGVQGDLGNNLFLDVGTVVYNPYNYPQGFVGNAWAESN